MLDHRLNVRLAPGEMINNVAREDWALKFTLRGEILSAVKAGERTHVLVEFFQCLLSDHRPSKRGVLLRDGM